MVDRAAAAHMGKIGDDFGLHLQQDNLRRRVAHMLELGCWIDAAACCLPACVCTCWLGAFDLDVS
jgi:hypothetical protein